ncbi:amidohydrolase family protein [Shewanella saliphila]|uniref:Amidohydrolase n=1 Tax=Shewanella saliphila TaxID=2282698 RepID=A0ABQ2Q876_9GAMM|nr:amidohydrolase family protein [Shewanella saliphila]MCL1102569.1 amidohydrolase family protein [Shewanella saliphila]GGP57430.1 amidohydrolase [Shewanella saliphila]
MTLFTQSALALSLSISLAFGANLAQADSLAIINATVHTATEQGVLNNATVVIENGTITAINPDNPQADSVIDAKGATLTPGFIAAMNDMGLVEVGAVATSRDARDKEADIGFEPSFAFNPLASTIPFARKGGITRNIVTSGGGESIFAGQTFVVDLSGDFDSVIANNTGLYVELGATDDGSRAMGMQQLIHQLEDTQKTLTKAKKANKSDKDDSDEPSREDSIITAVLSGDIPLIVAVDRASDIIHLIKLKQDFELDLIIVNGADAVLVAEPLAQANIPVVIDAMRNLPESFDSLHNSLENAGKLAKAGVKVAIALPGDSHSVYALRYSAGNAVANGMDYNDALAALTANIADIFHLDSGRIAVGKPADLVLWSGDPFEFSTSIEKMWIAGEEQSLQSRQDELRDRYLKKTDMPAAYR